MRLRIPRSSAAEASPDQLAATWLSPDARRALRVLRAVRARLLRRKDVVAVGMGRPEVKGKRMRREPFAIVVTVRKKVPPDAVGAHRLLPPSIRGVRVDVVEGNPSWHANGCVPASSPRRTGVGVGSLRGGLGLGDATSGDFLATSCANLAHADGTLHALTALHAVDGHPVLQFPPPAAGSTCSILATAPPLDAVIAPWTPALPVASGAHGAATGWVEAPVPGEDTRLLVGGACSDEVACKVIAVGQSIVIGGNPLHGLIKIEAAAGTFFRAGDSGAPLMSVNRTLLVAMFVAGDTPAIANRGYCVPIGRILTAAGTAGFSLL